MKYKEKQNNFSKGKGSPWSNAGDVDEYSQRVYNQGDLGRETDN